MKRNLKRLPALLLAIILCLSLLPVTALAAFPSKFYASVNYKYSSYSKSVIFGTVTQSGGTLTYTGFGEKTDRVVYGMEYAGGAFYTVEGTKLNRNVDDGFRELRMYNSNLTSYRTIGTVSERNYAIVDTAMDLSGAEPALYGTYNTVIPDVIAMSMICTIDLETATPGNYLQVTGLPDMHIIYAIAFDKAGTLYAIGADAGDDGGPASLYTIDLKNASNGKVSATLVEAIKNSSGKAISTNWIQDLAFDHANDTLYWMENKSNVLYTVNTETATATRVGSLPTLHAFCIPYDAAFAENKHMVSVVCEGAGTVTSGGDNKPFYMVDNDGSITLNITPDTGSGLRYVKVDGKSVSVDNLTEYTFSNVTENHVIEVAFKVSIPATQKTVTWLHYQGEPAKFYTVDNVYKFYDLPYLDKEVPREDYTQTLLDEKGNPIDDNEIILPGNYDVHVTHPGNAVYAALDVIYEDALQLAKCPGTPGRPVVYGKVGCKQGDLVTTSALQDYYGTDGKLIDAAHDEIPVTLEWLNPETVYNTAGNFYASATIHAADELDPRLKACYTLDDGSTLEEGCQISSRATQVIVLPADEASLIKVLASDASGGTVSGKGVYKNGTEVTVTATANTNAGYAFLGWYENEQRISDAGATYTFEASVDRTLTAKFETDPEYRVILQSDPQDAGTVTGGGNYKEGTHQATVKATANQGYYFIGWYEGETLKGGEAEYTFTVLKDGITLTAKFGIDYLARAEQAKEYFDSALGTDAFEWRTLVQAMDAYEAAEAFMDDLPDGVKDAEDRFETLTDYYESVEELDLSNLGIGNDDLEELELFTGVTDLNLSGNRGVSDLTGLPNMTQLETLDLSSTGITNLTNLPNPTGLKDLNLSNTGIRDEDLTALSNLTTLETLNLSNTGVSNLDSLSSLTTLETLNLSGNRGISDLSGLTGLSNLETLNISGTGVTALDSLITEGQSNFPGYKNLTAQNLSLTSLSVLAKLVDAEGFSATNITKWDFTGSTLTDTEANKTDVETIQDKLNEQDNKLLPPTIGTSKPDIPDIPVTPVVPSGSNKDDDDDSYSVSVPASSSIRGGAITVTPRSAGRGDTVTVMVKPGAGYELDTLTVIDPRGNQLALTDRGSGKYTFTMPASRVSVEVRFRPVGTAPVNPFTDVSSGAYYEAAVLWAVEHGVTNGTTAVTFSPGATVTRAQMVTFLWRSCGSPGAAGGNPFTDVSADAYYYDAVLWAVENGVTNGTTATTFSPDAPVTRAQAVTFQWRTAGAPAASGGSFNDVSDNAYYAVAVSWAVANGITNGTTAATFSPDTPVSRAQAVTFLYRELA